MAVQVANPFAAFMAGREAREAERARAQQAEREGLQTQLLQQRIQSQPVEMADAAKLRELEIQGAEQGIAGQLDAKKQAAFRQIGSLSQQALKSGNPRAFVAAALQNPAYAGLYQAAGIDPSNVNLDSPDFIKNLEVSASMGPQVSADNQFDAAEAEKQRAFTAAENAKNRAAQAQQRTAGSAPPSGYQFTQDGQLAPIPGGPADPSRKPSNLRPIPPSIAKGIVENRQQLRKIDEAIAAAEAYPSAFGAQNYLGDAIQQRLDPDGVEGRARISDIGSLKINDRSGAAVSAKEFPRLQPFIPTATDNPETVKKKLGLFRAEVAAMQEDMESSYSEATGYQPLPGAGGGRGATGAWEQGGGIQPGQSVNMGGFTVTRKK